MYFQLYNPRKGKKLAQQFTSKVDAELFVEERRAEHPRAMKGWLVRACFNDERREGTCLSA